MAVYVLIIPPPFLPVTHPSCKQINVPPQENAWQRCCCQRHQFDSSKDHFKLVNSNWKAAFWCLVNHPLHPLFFIAILFLFLFLLINYSITLTPPPFLAMFSTRNKNDCLLSIYSPKNIFICIHGLFLLTIPHPSLPQFADRISPWTVHSILFGLSIIFGKSCAIVFSNVFCINLPLLLPIALCHSITIFRSPLQCLFMLVWLLLCNLHL